MRRLLGFVAAVACGAGLLGGCGMTSPGGGDYPGACDDLEFDERRCRAVIDKARSSIGIDPAEIARIQLAPPARRDGGLGRGQIAVVTFTLVDGTVRSHALSCGGVGSPSDRACQEQAVLVLGGTRVDSDVPCAGEPPAGCATEPPTPRPESVVVARALTIPALDVPLDHTGPYEVLLGEAGLPDGYLTDVGFSLADLRPITFWIDGGVRLDIRPVDPDRPPVGNRYREPFDGVEPVRAFLVFDVTETSPGAVLEVRDIVVR